MDMFTRVLMACRGAEIVSLVGKGRREGERNEPAFERGTTSLPNLPRQVDHSDPQPYEAQTEELSRLQRWEGRRSSE